MAAPKKFLCILIGLVTLSGCGDDEPTDAESLDNQVNNSWLDDRNMVDAVTFLEGGGIYESTPEIKDIDSRYLLPLVRRMKNEFGLDVQAVLDSPRFAFAIVADVSKCEKRSAIVAAIEETDREFPGIILDNWGNQWLSLDMLDEREASSMKKSGQLDLLRQHIAARRAKYGVTAESAE